MQPAVDRSLESIRTIYASTERFHAVDSSIKYSHRFYSTIYNHWKAEVLIKFKINIVTINSETKDASVQLNYKMLRNIFSMKRLE